MTDSSGIKYLEQYVCFNSMQVGSKGTVFRGCLLNNTTECLAIKQCELHSESESLKTLDLIKMELKRLQNIKHPNFIKIYDVIKNHNMLYFIQMYCEDGSLQDYLAQRKDKPLSEAIQFIVKFGQYHSQQLKTIQHPLKQRSGSDLRSLLRRNSPIRNANTQKNLPFPSHLAPEVLHGQPYTNKCDIWSLGLIFYQMLYGVQPWYAQNIHEWLDNISKFPLQFPPRPTRKQNIKELLTKMLTFSQEDRISFQDLIQDPVLIIKQDEEQIDFQGTSDKDEFLYLIKANGVILEKNLVVKYLMKEQVVLSLEENQWKQSDVEARIQQCYYEKEPDISVERMAIKYKNDKKKKDIFQKYYQYFIFERNIAFFFNFLVQRIVKLQVDWQIQLQIDFYHRLIYLIAKYQMIILTRISNQLQANGNHTFDQDLWGRFQKSQQYQLLVAQIEQDGLNSLDFYKSISKRCQQVLREEFENNKHNQLIVGMINNFSAVLNENFEANEIFNVLFRECIMECLKVVKTLASKQVDINLLNYYLLVSLNPYDEFKDINYDFNTFYEDSENYSFQELQEKLAKKSNK
ncbi:unnamed protein product (macronuclear) [Paramecium tetraurelia]|uniref:Protein kinase domain-containing protein n=1 Tax=Paramecium tetraurelia TaxID=5888 RepID=A0DKR3_PARTE|nr:uncharacterized protein GSPATT00017960001 [Paramecium tetraurelia]CAK83630.1 unnamed protein product [Paramecium tetraurelia]|eukprot:XP_001451027.1 hypothetical protein (macronuclear) [Paramecium tetraurelia strain d4-2]